MVLAEVVVEDSMKKTTISNLEEADSEAEEEVTTASMMTRTDRTDTTDPIEVAEVVMTKAPDSEVKEEAALAKAEVASEKVAVVVSEVEE